MGSGLRDLENQLDGGEDLGIDVNEPLLPSWSSRARYSRARLQQEVIELDDIPPIIKSANGNIFWADEQCTRRVGLTSTEARLLLRLLQVDEPENYNYNAYKEMFDDFGREQKRLQELVDDLPWWSLERHQQKKIWKARIQWLNRMEEPRLWLLYLMARRRRILKQATQRVFQRLKEKRELRLLKKSHPSQQQLASFNGESAIGTIMANDACQTSETEVDIHSPTDISFAPPVMMNEASQTSDTQLNRTSRILSAASRIRQSLSSGHRDSHSRERHSRRSSGHCPVFDKPWDATREDIKRQVEKLMPETQPYIVIGWFLRSASDPKERILQFEREEQLFHILRHGEGDVRGWRRFISLKSLQGFGLYKCDIARGAHIPLLLTTSQQAVLSQFYLAYRASHRHSDDTVAKAWQGWVKKNLNANSDNPLEGRYSLQLIYDWSSHRLTAIVAIPLLLSLAIGFWYMSNGEGDVITAWTLALYIVTAAAALIALLAIIGSLKDI